MIVIDNISKRFEVKNRHKIVFENASVKIPSDGNVVILGKPGSGNSVLIKLIGNSLFPDSGRIKINETVSWPVGFKNQLINNLSGIENIEFVSMLKYSDMQKRKEVRELIADFTELGKALESPIKTYSKSMKDRLSFALCFAYEFDTYLVDEFSFDSDELLRRKAWKFIANERSKSRIISTDNEVEEFGNKYKYVILIKDNRLVLFDDVGQGVEEYQKMIKV